jgi:putative endonuclease
MASQTHWSLYILLCADGTLYTGITNDLDRRVKQHNLGQGAKYTRGRGPLELVYSEHCSSHSEALKREYLVKQMSVQQKRQLIADFQVIINPAPL